MITSTERLIHLILRTESFYEAENVELNSILRELDPQQIPTEYRKEVVKIIDMMFLTNNVPSENEAHVNRIHNYLIQNATPC